LERAGGAELPPRPQRARRNRVWMVLLMLTPVCLAVVSLLTFATGGPNEPAVTPRVTPPGYYGITDAYFGYAIPKAYRQNTTWTDQHADFFYGRAPAFVAETLLETKKAPTATSRPPLSFQSFGEQSLMAYSLSGTHPVRVPGTTEAFEGTITRPGGYHAVAVDAWEQSTSTQIWLLVRAPAAVTAAVVDSLRG
jgi:hypothetical protein